MQGCKYRTCRICGVEKPETQFYVTKRVRGREYRSSYCCLCHGARALEDTRRRMAQNYIRLWTWFVDHPCVDCGETNPLKLQLDHRDPALKRADVSSLMKAPWRRVARELELCDSRCSNCHAVKTAASLGYFATEELREYLAEWPENKEAYDKYAA